MHPKIQRLFRLIVAAAMSRINSVQPSLQKAGRRMARKSEDAMYRVRDGLSDRYKDVIAWASVLSAFAVIFLVTSQFEVVLHKASQVVVGAAMGWVITNVLLHRAEQRDQNTAQERAAVLQRNGLIYAACVLGMCMGL